MTAHNNVQYYYFGRNIWKQHRGIVTAGVVLPDNPNSGANVDVAFAFCSPVDEFRRRNEDAVRTVWARKAAPTPDNPHGYEVEETQIPVANPLPGGCDIVDARLGLAPDPNYPERFQTTPIPDVRFRDRATGRYGIRPSLMHAVIDAFNERMPTRHKPRLWKDRYLVYDTPLRIATLNSVDLSERISATVYIADDIPWMLGFIPSPVIQRIH